MARQLGAIKYGGTIGDIRHFKIKGLAGNFAGLKGGATAEQIKNDPAFVRTRENMNEFGGCAMIGKSFRNGFSQVIKQMSDSQLTGRITGIMKKINLEDQSESRGYRAILVSMQPQYLLGLNFNRNNSFEGLFNTPVVSMANSDRTTVTLLFDPFNTQNNVNAPAGATHFRLLNAISVLSDFAYNSTTKVYEPVDSQLNELSKISYSDYIELGINNESPLIIESSLPGNPVMSPNVCLISCVGIEFYQKVGENYYQFNTGNALKIQNVF